MRGLSGTRFCCKQVSHSVNRYNRAVEYEGIIAGHYLSDLAVYCRFFKELIREVRQWKSLIGILGVGLLLLSSNILGSYSYRKIGLFIGRIVLAVFVDVLIYRAYFNDLIGYFITLTYHFLSIP